MRFGAATMALLAVLVALFSFRFVGVIEGVWIDVDPGIRGVVTAHPFEALTHILIAPIALLLGPFSSLRGSGNGCRPFIAGRDASMCWPA